MRISRSCLPLRLAGLVLLLAGSGLGLCAAGPADSQVMLRVDDPRVAAIEYLAKSRGLVNGLPVKPWSLGQARDILARLVDPQAPSLDTDLARLAGWNRSLSPGAQQLVQSLLDELKPRKLIAEQGFSLDCALTLGLETWLHTNPVDQGETGQWEYDYNERTPLLDVDTQALWGTGGEAGDLFHGFWGDMDIDLREDQNVINMYLDASHPANDTNIPEDFTYIDFQFPHRAMLSTGGADWLLVVGRDRLDLGNGHRGNLGVSATPDFYDFGRFQLLSDWFNYTALWINLESDLEGLSNLEPQDSSGVVYDYEAAKNLFLHRFDLNFWNTLHFGFTEAMLVGGVQPTIEYMNPFMVFHNLYPWNDGDFMSASAFMGLELTFNPVRFVSLWAQYGQNQFQTPMEVEQYPGANTIPNAWGALAGADLTLPLEPAAEPAADAGNASGGVGPWFLSAGLEWAYTNPWFYIRENGLNTWFWRRRLVSNVVGGIQFVTKSIGWHLGPDSHSIGAWVGLERHGLASLEMNLEYRLQGEQTLTTPYQPSSAAASLVTPTGIPQETWIAGLSAAVTLFPAGSWDQAWLPRTGLHGDLKYLYQTGHVTGAVWEDFQVVLGIDLGW